MASRTTWLRRTRRFLTIFGFPLGLQKSQKINFLLKRVLQGTPFYRFSWQISLFLFFWSFFDRFSMKNLLKNQCMFSQLRVFFSNLRPSRNTVFYDAKATFSFFGFLIFFEKLMKKTTENFTCQKSRKMTPGGPQNTPKILKKWSQNRQKSRKMPKKLIF